MKVISLLVGMVPLVHALVITEPCCSEYPHRVSAFGPALPVKGLSSSRTLIEEIDENIALAGSDMCSSSTTDFNDTIVVVPRGGCSFGQKVLNSQAAGAVAVVVYETDTSLSGVVTMSANPTDSAATEIPSVFVSATSGASVVGLLANVSGSAVGVLNATGSVSYSIPYYDFTIYTMVMLLCATAAFLLVVAITITGVCQRRRVGDGDTKRSVLVPGEYDGGDLSGGGLSGGGGREQEKEMQMKMKELAARPPPGKISGNPRYGVQV